MATYTIDKIEYNNNIYNLQDNISGYVATSSAAASGGTTLSLVTTGEKYTWNSKTSNNGTVKSVATADGLTGGTITTTGTLKANLRSFTKLDADSEAATEISGRIYPIALDHTGYLAVVVPWIDTTYSAGTGLTLDGTTFKHSNSVTASTAGTSSATSGSTLAVPYVTYDAQGHITATGTHTHTITGFSASDHTHTLTLATDTGTSTVSLTHGGKFKLTAGGKSVVFTMPSENNPTTATNHTTGISIAAHGTASIGSASDWSAGTASSWVFEEKTIPNVTSAGSASTWTFEEISIPNVTSAGSASTWVFEEKTIPNVTNAGTASSWTFEEISVPNVTAAGSGSFTSGAFNGGSGSASLTFAMDDTDTRKLKVAFSHTHTPATHGADSHTHTAPTIGTAIKIQSKSGGSNGTTPTIGTSIKVQSKKSGSNGTAPTIGDPITVYSKSGGNNGSAPTLGTSIKVQSKKSGSNSTVPSLTVTSTTVVTGATHSITDNGHTHTLS